MAKAKKDAAKKTEKETSAPPAESRPRFASPQVYEPGQEQPSNLPKGPSLGDDTESAPPSERNIH